MSYTGLHLPDVSEFQGNIRWKLPLAQSGGAAIIRALYGADYEDSQFQANLAKLRKAGAKVIGIYQYIRKDQDVLVQAQAFVKLVKKLYPGEFAIMDLEESDHPTDDQSGRAKVWLGYVDKHLTYTGYNGACLYSYEDFVKVHNLLAIFQSKRHCWLADYNPPPEPADEPHSLWQHTDGRIGVCQYEPWPAIGPCDCSQFDGTADELLAKVYTKPKPKPPAPDPTWMEKLMADLAVVRYGEKGVNVRRMQALLVANGAQLGGPVNDGIDGDFGSATLSAVNAFQKKFGITPRNFWSKWEWAAALTGTKEL